MANATTYYIQKDVLEAYFSTGSGDNVKHYFIGLTTDSGITRDVDQEKIRAGIGSKVVGVLNNDNGYTANITTGLYYKDIAELQLGSEFEAVTDVDVYEIEEDEDGKITATTTKVAGDAIELEADAFGKSGVLQLHTIIHSDENEVVGDLYIILDKAVPDSNFSQTFGMGTNNTQEVVFTGLVPKGQTSYGRYLIVPRTAAWEGEESPGGENVAATASITINDVNFTISAGEENGNKANGIEIAFDTASSAKAEFSASNGTIRLTITLDETKGDYDAGTMTAIITGQDYGSDENKPENLDMTKFIITGEGTVDATSTVTSEVVVLSNN